MKYQSLDRFTGKITGNPHEFNGKKKTWFPVKIFPTNQSNASNHLVGGLEHDFYFPQIGDDDPI